MNNSYHRIGLTTAMLVLQALSIECWGYGSDTRITGNGVTLRRGTEVIHFAAGDGDPLRDALDYMRAEALLVRAFGGSDLFSVFSEGE
jgi:hypothetical protein